MSDAATATAGSGPDPVADPASDLGAGAGRRRPRAVLLLLGLVICAAVALRVWYLPAPGRFGGERESIANVESRLAGRELRHPELSPLAWVPQLLTIRLSDRLHDLTGFEALHVTTAKGRVTRRGLVVARGLALAPAIAGLLLLFAIGRRLHAPGVALMAVLMLAFAPWHVQASVSLAPGILLLAFSALALWLAMRALDEPTAGRFALVGLALGAAAATQPSGGLIAVPVLLGLILGGGRRWRGAALALAVTLPLAAGVWWVLTPPWDGYAASLAQQRAKDAARAAGQMSSRFTVAVFGLLMPLRDTAHGGLLGSLALLGAAGQAFRCLFLVDPGPDRGPRLMVLAAAPALILGTAWETPLFRESDFAPLLLFSSLYAAVMLGILWETLGELLPALRSPPAASLAAALAAGLVAVLVVPPGWGYVRSRAVGSTIGEALAWLRQDQRAGVPRLVFVEEAALGGSAGGAMDLAAGIGLRVVPRLAAVGEERLGRADAEVFLSSELEGPEAAFYRARREAGTGQRRFAGSLLWRRGPGLVAVRHSRGGAASPVELALAERGGALEAVVPPAPEAAFISLALRLPRTDVAEPAAPRVSLDGARLELAAAGRLPAATLFFSERIAASGSPGRLEITPPPWASAGAGGIEGTLYLWP